MNFFDKLEKTVSETGQGISRKAKELAEVTRLKNMLHTCEEVMDQNYREIGRAYYEAHQDEEAGEYAEQIRAIRDAARGAEALKKQIEEIGAQS
ncbi:MAG: hypothetical protein J6C33_12815 [Lachnospiraceae bacterium]|nr:hypothetical protein [Lachnospiraceae bacterium]